MAEKTTIPETKMAAWIALMRSQTALLRAVEAALKAADLPQLSWYDVLLELSRPGVEGLRPMELEIRLLLPQYSTSRLLDRMEKEGLIARVKVPEDARGHLVRITDKGRATQARMWPVYASVLDDAFASKLTDAEADTLERLLSKF